jgi:hypothetical protein
MSASSEQSQSGSRWSRYKKPVTYAVIAGLAAALVGSVVGDLNGLAVGKKSGIVAERLACLKADRDPRVLGTFVLNGSETTAVIDGKRTVNQVSPRLATLLIESGRDSQVTAKITDELYGVADSSDAASIAKFDENLTTTAAELAGALSYATGSSSDTIGLLTAYAGPDATSQQLDLIGSNVVTISSTHC